VNKQGELTYALAFSIFGGASALSADDISFIAAIVGALFTLSVFLFKQITRMVNAYTYLTSTVAEIHQEIFIDENTTLKKTVLELRSILSRIEKAHKIMEQRSRSSLHYNDYALFETDKNGHLIWANDKFCSIIELQFHEILGNDWYAIIDEEKREAFIEEFRSCLQMSRRLEIETNLHNGLKARFCAHPYKIEEHNQEGFLLRLILL
jgi:PAS domain S-box-containing protein